MKGAYKEPASVAFQPRREVDESYRTCLGVLFAGGAYPMVATHDPALISFAEGLARLSSVPFEFQMRYGIRRDEQLRLASSSRVRIYLPYGSDWYGYFMRRLAERPANLLFFLRSFVPERRPR